MNFADWFYDVRALAGEDGWGEISDQTPTLIVLWNGGATVAQAFDMISVILPPVPRAAKRPIARVAIFSACSINDQP
jgi:hypothetical protein